MPDKNGWYQAKLSWHPAFPPKSFLPPLPAQSPLPFLWKCPVRRQKEEAFLPASANAVRPLREPWHLREAPGRSVRRVLQSLPNQYRFASHRPWAPTPRSCSPPDEYSNGSQCLKPHPHFAPPDFPDGLLFPRDDLHLRDAWWGKCPEHSSLKPREFPAFPHILRTSPPLPQYEYRFRYRR